MQSSVWSRFAIVALLGFVIVGCRREGAPAALSDDMHDLGPPARSVRIKVKCRAQEDGLQIDWAIRPNRKRINRREEVTWVLQNSDVASVLVDAKDPSFWPFRSDQYTVTSTPVMSGPADSLAMADVPYRYTVTATCTGGGDTAITVLDPDVIIRGSGSVDTLGNVIP